MDRFQLFNSLVNRQPIEFDGVATVVVNSIQAEDGSGFKFIVSGQHVGYSKSIKLYVHFAKDRTLKVAVLS